MRLFEAIVDANHRALAGDESAGLRPSDFADSLPLIALTCIDPRLHPLMPEVLGIPEDKFIWLRNAGNIITSPTSSTMRSLALACAVKGGREIAIIGHTDCLVGKTSVMQLTDRLKALGIERAHLPEDITAFFGIFGSERQNVLKAAEYARNSPLIGPNIPVHGLLVDIRTGKLEWLVNGYESLGRAAVAAPLSPVGQALQGFDSLLQMAPFHIGEMKFPETKIGEVAGRVEQTAGAIGQIADKIGDLIPGHTKADQIAETVEQAATKIGQAAAHVEDWIEKRRRQEPKQRPVPPPPPKAPPAKPVQTRPAPKPIPMPPPFIQPRPPRGRDDS